jgi:4-amino-4-deoxy-L-arabinose transferase-like glycosyltransferase
MNKKAKFNTLAIYLIPILFAGAIKVFISPVDITPFNADEAIVALMARHINQGNIPVFFYGQSYMGSLDAMLVAIGFRIFGEEVWVIRLVQSLLYIGTVFTTMILANRLLKSQRATLYAGLIMAVPPINVALYSTVSLGGYGEMLLVGNLLILGGLSIVQQIRDSESVIDSKLYLGLFLWGIGAGFGFWIIGLTVVYSLPLVILIFWYLIKKTSWKAILPGLVFLAGGIIGSAPWWFSSVQTGNLAIIHEIAGSAIKATTTGSWILKPLQRTLNLFIFGGTALIGLRPPWDIRWLMLPLIPIILIFWISVLIFNVKKVIESEGDIGLKTLALMGLVLTAGFILSPYGDDPSGRYFLPLMMPMSIFGANLLKTQFPKKRILEYVTILLVLVFNFGGILQATKMNPPGITTQFDKVAQVDQRYMGELIEFLQDNQIRAGYSNYWVSYPLAFLSGEEMIFLPRLPYHEDFRYTARDDRYYPYQQVVKAASELAYITTNHPELNDYLRERFSNQGITWEENRVGDFQIFFNLSQSIHVDELGLGVTTTP